MASWFGRPILEPEDDTHRYWSGPRDYAWATLWLAL